MARPTWTPRTDEQRDALAAIDRAADAADQAAGLLHSKLTELWAAVDAARAVSVPARTAAKRARRGRSSLYRHANAAPGHGSTAGGKPPTTGKT